jgi:hypothetical protein
MSVSVSTAARIMGKQRMANLSKQEREELGRRGPAVRFAKAAEANRLVELKRKLELQKEKLVADLK